MATTDDITSTEKLLDVIRGNSTDGFAAAEKPSDSSSKKSELPKKGMSLPKIFLTEKKIYTVGVDLGHGFLRLCKTTRAHDGKPVLVDYKIVGYSKVAKDSPQFKEILKSSLISFCGNPANCHIWVLMSAADVNVQHIKVPRVAKKQLENAIYWTAKKENPFNENDYIFDFELQGEIIDQGIPKYSVMVYTAPKAELESVKKIFSDIGIALTGVTVTPFAIQNILRKKGMPFEDGAVASLFIGNDFSRIDVYNKEHLVMTRGIKTGITSIMESITESYNEGYPDVRIGKEEARKILFSLAPDSPQLTPKDPGFDLSKEEIYEMTMPALERLVRQVERTLEHYSSSFGFEKVVKIYISSAMGVYEQLIQYINEQVGIKIDIFDPFIQQTIRQVDAKAISIQEKMSLVPAFGLSCSDNFETPNFIFTYQEKNKETTIGRLNKGIFAVFAVALIISLTILVFQGLDAGLQNNKLTKLQKDMTSYNPLLSKDLIEKMSGELAIKQQLTRKYAERYTNLAAIGEVSNLTPANIRLLNLKITLARTAKDKTDKTTEKTDKSIGDVIALEGLVSGDRNMLDSYLAQYIMKLDSSPMFSLAKLEKSNIINFKKNEVLQFTLNARIGK
ncbi:MAG: hypothetical protein CVU54_16805 [Deltaproteobacteria bacterium HGW-Deltaproteobacteria-12]|nr:MAG: hypothetical protein CVU54_16805 [Deltaproteobacteria bacterium HGW-Deltaproteobacteria-12]